MDTTTTSKIMMSSTSCGPFLEENIVSRQIDKSIYMKDQAYDGQTQHTEQTMKPSATMRTGYMASAFTEDIQISSITTTSTPIEDKTNICYNKFLIHHNIPILSKPQSLSSFIQYLYYNNFTQSFKISINTTYNETHIYINNNDPLLPNYI